MICGEEMSRYAVKLQKIELAAATGLSFTRVFLGEIHLKNLCSLAGISTNNL